MIQNADHVTFAVRDPEAAIAFFALLGFENVHDTVIDGGEPAVFMGDPTMKARHVTLELTGSSPSFQVQLLHFDPPPTEAPVAETRRVHEGFNHLALRVDDLAATSAALVAAGVEPLNEPMHFIGRNLQFFGGPRASPSSSSSASTAPEPTHRSRAVRPPAHRCRRWPERAEHHPATSAGTAVVVVVEAGPALPHPPSSATETSSRAAAAPVRRVTTAPPLSTGPSPISPDGNPRGPNGRRAEARGCRPSGRP